MCSKSLLRELECTLVLSDTEELDDTLLVRGEAANLADYLANDLAALGDLSLCVRGSLREGCALCDDMTLAEADCDARHFGEMSNELGQEEEATGS